MAETDFRALLEGLVRRFGTRDALGRLIGMSGSRVGRALSGQYSAFNVENCLKLADRTGESASVILRAAGKGSIADLIERLYGRAQPTVDPTVRSLLADWADLSADERAALAVVIAHAAKHAREEHEGKKSVRKRSA